MSKRVDPRVVRTKAELTSALFALMQERRWDKIRVQDVLDRTGISRSAFYAHFGGKYDLLVAGIPILHVTVDDDGNPDFLPLFVHIDEMSDIMQPLLSQPVLGDVMADFHRSFVAMWTKCLAGTRYEDDWLLPELLSGGVLAIAKTYAAQRERQNPAIVAQLCDDHIARLLANH